MLLVKVTKSIEKFFGFKNEINWKTTSSLIFLHTFGLYLGWKYGFPAKLSTIFFVTVVIFINGIGVTCGVHRCFTHKSYKVNTPLKLFLLACFSSAGQGAHHMYKHLRLFTHDHLIRTQQTLYSGNQDSVYNWVRDHRTHHKCSDTSADPHDATRGLFFSQIGWLMMKKNMEVKREGRTIDMSDIKNDSLLMFQHKIITTDPFVFIDRYSVYFNLLFCYIIPTIAHMLLLNDSWQVAVTWQCFIRILSIIHMESTVNSLAHAHGSKPYNRNILPHENTFVARLTIGEGWHNYHHVFPFDYKAAEYFDKINVSAMLIKWWAKKGWAYDLKEASPDMIKSVIKRVGDGSQPCTVEKHSSVLEGSESLFFKVLESVLMLNIVYNAINLFFIVCKILF